MKPLDRRLPGQIGWKLAFFIVAATCSHTTTVHGQDIPIPDQPDKPPPEVRQLHDLLKPSRLAAPNPADTELQKIRKERYATALQEMGLRFERFMVRARGELMETLLELIHRISDSEQALTDKLNEKIAAVDRALAIAEQMERVCKQKREGGLIGESDYLQARYYRLSFQIQRIEMQRNTGNILPRAGNASQPQGPPRDAFGGQPLSQFFLNRAGPGFNPGNPWIQLIQQVEKELPGVRSVMVYSRPVANDDELTRLGKERFDCALREMESIFERQMVRSAQSDFVAQLLAWVTRLLESELALIDSPQDRVAIFERSVALARIAEFISKTKLEAGLIAPQDYERAHFVHLDLQTKLIQAKERAAK